MVVKTKKAPKKLKGKSVSKSKSPKKGYKAIV